KYEVTQGQWEAVMGNDSNLSHFQGSKRLPVEKVNWDDAKAFCGKLKLPSGLVAGLPTEAEWEYACRVETTTVFSFGNTLNGREENCNGNFPYGAAMKGAYLERTTEVGSYGANRWGLHDMHGNVWELCEDRYGTKLAGGQDPTGPNDGVN